jgi:hypothetical protein
VSPRDSLFGYLLTGTHQARPSELRRHTPGQRRDHSPRVAAAAITGAITTARTMLDVVRWSWDASTDVTVPSRMAANTMIKLAKKTLGSGCARIHEDMSTSCQTRPLRRYWDAMASSSRTLRNPWPKWGIPVQDTSASVGLDRWLSGPLLYSGAVQPPPPPPSESGCRLSPASRGHSRVFLLLVIENEACESSIHRSPRIS